VNNSLFYEEGSQWKGIQNLRLDANVYTTVTKTYGEIA
jgi:hypothetical protein